jgi:phosphatidylserine/phosphatidylglycerophosphate/cardiolipin synthase-like enzyme
MFGSRDLPSSTLAPTAASLLVPGSTCWRKLRAPRAALLLDMAEYFKAAKIAIGNAKRSVHFLNWAFDPTTYFHPEPGCTGPELDQIGPFLVAIADERPQLDVRILCWKSSLPIAATQNFFPHRARKCFRGTRVKFRLDSAVPLGACHHQKLIVIDDEVAFCGGGDIGPDRPNISTTIRAGTRPRASASSPGTSSWPWSTAQPRLAWGRCSAGAGLLRLANACPSPLR